MYHASQWLKNSGFGLPKKKTPHSLMSHFTWSSKTTCHFKTGLHHLPTLCLMTVATPICRRIRRSKNPTSRAFTSSNTSQGRIRSCINLWHQLFVRHFGDFFSQRRGKHQFRVMLCYVVILHGLSHPVFWICFATEFFGFMLDNLMVRIGFKRQFSAHHISKGNSQPVELLSHLNST